MKEVTLPQLEVTMAKKMTVKEAFHEVKHNPPSTLKKQSKKKMRKQIIAIALSKAGKSKKK